MDPPQEMSKVLGEVASRPVYHRVGYPSARERVSDYMENLSSTRPLTNKIIALGHDHVVSRQLFEWSFRRIEHIVVSGVGLSCHPLTGGLRNLTYRTVRILSRIVG